MGKLTFLFKPSLPVNSSKNGRISVFCLQLNLNLTFNLQSSAFICQILAERNICNHMVRFHCFSIFFI